MAKRYSRKTKTVRRRRRTRGGGPKLNAFKNLSKKAARGSMKLGTKGVGYGLKGLSYGVKKTGQAAKKLSEVTPSISNKLQNMGEKTLNKAADMKIDNNSNMPVEQPVSVGGARKRTRKNKRGGKMHEHEGGNVYNNYKRRGGCSAAEGSGGAKKSRKRTKRNTRKTNRRVRRR